MAYQDVTSGNNAPDEVNVIIEISKGQRNKYEHDKKTDVMFLDRVTPVAMGYPTDYGYVPGTLCEDGDPLDAMVIIDEPIPQGCLVVVRPLGVLYMVDSGEGDEKLITVAVNDNTKSHIKTVDDLGPNFKKMIEHFYVQYKAWKNDWQGQKVEFKDWGGAEEAKKVITQSIARARQ